MVTKRVVGKKRGRAKNGRGDVAMHERVRVSEGNGQGKEINEDGVRAVCVWREELVTAVCYIIPLFRMRLGPPRLG